MWPHMPYMWSLDSNRLWLTLSNALDQSRNTASILGEGCWSRIEDQSWYMVTNLVAHDLPWQKPCWPSATKPCILRCNCNLFGNNSLHDLTSSRTQRNRSVVSEIILCPLFINRHNISLFPVLRKSSRLNDLRINIVGVLVTMAIFFQSFKGLNRLKCLSFVFVLFVCLFVFNKMKLIDLSPFRELTFMLTMICDSTLYVSLNFQNQRKIWHNLSNSSSKQHIQYHLTTVSVTIYVKKICRSIDISETGIAISHL